MKKIIPLIALALLAFGSCKKDYKVVDNEIGTCGVIFLSPLQIGNYWIYNSYTINNGQKTFDYVDSLVISRDTFLNNQQYFVFEDNGYQNSGRRIAYIIRDSSGYRVNHLGEIVFAQNDFDRVLSDYYEIQNNDTIYRTERTMVEYNNSINTDVGTFDFTINAKEKITFLHNGGGGTLPKYQNTNYAQGIGIVFRDEIYLLQNLKHEKYLTRYSVN